MKVDRTKGTSLSGPRRAGKTGSAGSSGFSKLLDPVGATDQVAGPSVTRGVDSVFAAQEVGDREGGARKARDRAELMLERLEDVRDGLLMGAVPRDRLRELATAARQNREAFDDPRLTEILDEIELRARVELAKLDRSV